MENVSICFMWVIMNLKEVSILVVVRSWCLIYWVLLYLVGMYSLFLFVFNVVNVFLSIELLSELLW